MGSGAQGEDVASDTWPRDFVSANRQGDSVHNVDAGCRGDGMSLSNCFSSSVE